MKWHLIFMIFCGIASVHLNAQLPTCHIYALSVDVQDEMVTLEKITILSADNPEGYNNQPSYMPDGRIYYASRQAGQDQTDIYSMEWGALSAVKTRITNSLEDEYSPTLHPDGQSFCCVRVEQDGETQHLWKFPLDRSGGGQVLLPQLTNVGYFQWLDDRTVALFEVGEPHKLVIRSTDGKNQKTIVENIGRTLLQNEHGHLVFIDIVSDEYRYIKQYDVEEGSLKIIKRIPNQCGDFAMSASNTFYIGNQGKLMRFRPGLDSEWKMILDLSSYRIHNITRVVTLDNDRFLIVDQK